MRSRAAMILPAASGIAVTRDFCTTFFVLSFRCRRFLASIANSAFRLTRRPHEQRKVVRIQRGLVIGTFHAVVQREMLFQHAGSAGDRRYRDIVPHRVIGKTHWIAESRFRVVMAARLQSAASAG